MKVNYDGIFRQESMALCNPEVIVIDDSSDDEEKGLVFPSEESPIKSGFFHPLPGSRGEAERGELGAHSETSASTADHHDVDDRPSAKRRQRELFRSSAGPFRDGKAAVALAMKSRRAKHAPPPTRLAELRRTYSYTDVYNMDETGFFLYNVPRVYVSTTGLDDNDDVPGWLRNVDRLQKMQPAGLSYNDLGRWAKSQFSLTPSLPPPSKAGVCRIVKMEDKLQVLGSESQAEKHLLPRRSLLLDVMQLETITFIEEQRLSAAVASSD
ncbi:hypothetical protein PF001_g2682 [Phytophthora fragariae]|uniref:Uncharacterized protein n=1 Tax=Phytophthora fragariae TaxID=53985 RepID=A0A6A4EXX4_9STRA|nr:hypothetical protein PF001_g2682 [Phytophthora fragariae]